MIQRLTNQVLLRVCDLPVHLGTFYEPYKVLMFRTKGADFLRASGAFSGLEFLREH